MWWENFIKWGIIGAQIGIFLWIATNILDPGARKIEPHDLLVVLVLLFVAVKVARKSSAIGAGAVMGLASGGIGLAMGATARLAKGGAKGALAGADKMTGGKLSSGAQAIKGSVGRTLERMGLRKTGTTASANTSRVDEEAKLMAAEYASAKATGNTAAVDRIRDWARNRRGVQGAAAMKVVSDAKDLHKAFADPGDPTGKTVNYGAAAARLKYAESVGAKDVIKDSEKVMPELKGHNEPAINEEMQKMDRVGRPVYPNTAAGRARATREVVKKQRAGMGVSEIRNISAPQLTPDAIEDFNYKTFDRAALEFTSEQHEAAKAAVPELWDRTLNIMSVPGATRTDKAAAWKAATLAQRKAWQAALGDADKKKTDDYLRKISTITR